MRNIWTVFKKEIYRVFSDRRLILTLFIMPGLAIFLIYSLMGNIIGAQETQVSEYEALIYTENMPAEIKTLMDESMHYRLYDGDALDQATSEQKVLEGELELVLLFDEDFTQKVEAYQTNSLPDIEVFYNQAEQRSLRAYNLFNGVLNHYHETTVIERLSEPSDYQVFDLQTQNIMDERAFAAQGFAMLLPMLIVIFLFAGAMSIGPDAIAGEKERGTIATLLVTPVQRRDIALGKVLSLSVLALLSALSSFIGVVLSLPNLMQMDDTMPDVSIYGMSDYLIILVLLMVMVLFIVAIIAAVSAYAKTIKEASMLIMPFYFLAMIVGVMNSFGGDVSHDVITHLIPIYGPVNLLSGMLRFEYQTVNFMVTVLSSLGYTVLLIALLNVMFKSERMMFQK